MKILPIMFMCLLFIAAVHSYGIIVSDATDDSIKNEEEPVSSGLIVSNTTDDSIKKKEDSDGEEGNPDFTLLAYLPKTKGETRLFGGNSYGRRTRLEISRRPSTWRAAMNSCYANYGVLVSIDNADLDRTVRYALLAKDVIYERVWTSGRFAYTGEPRHLSLFMWAGNGQELEYTNWKRWYGREPTASYEYDTCIAVERTGYYDSQYNWEMAHCDEELRFICVV